MVSNEKLNTLIDSMPDFEEIYKQYSSQIFRVCMGFVNDSEQAKDLTQETFIAVWNNLPRFRQESKISTWIYRIATNYCLKAVANHKKVNPIAIPENLQGFLDEVQEEKLNYLYKAIGELEELDRLIISLVLEDLPQAEIAEIIGISSINVRVKIHRIKEKLVLKFRKNGPFE